MLSLYSLQVIHHCGSKSIGVTANIFWSVDDISSQIILWGSDFGTLWSSIVVVSCFAHGHLPLSSIWLGHSWKYNSLCTIIEVYRDLYKLSCWHVILSLLKGFSQIKILSEGLCARIYGRGSVILVEKCTYSCPWPIYQGYFLRHFDLCGSSKSFVYSLMWLILLCNCDINACVHAYFMARNSG